MPLMTLSRNAVAQLKGCDIRVLQVSQRDDLREFQRYRRTADDWVHEARTISVAMMEKKASAYACRRSPGSCFSMMLATPRHSMRPRSATSALLHAAISEV